MTGVTEPAGGSLGPQHAEPGRERVHDVVGIGIGPFGLGMAALAEPLPDVDAVFLDQAQGFRWHPGMMLEGATVQVPFLADLVTMADPTSPYSFLAFLKAVGRLYPFYIRESFYPLRAEYDEYCRWVADQLTTLRWGRRVTAIEVETGGPEAQEHYRVRAELLDASGEVIGIEHHRGRHIVLAVGTSPEMPAPLHALRAAAAAHADEPRRSGPVVHSADYLPQREALLRQDSITLIGSGQSAAEIYRDLIEETSARGIRLDWLTRSPRFFPMEYTKLTLEMTSPEYTDHFRSLPEELRARLGREQRSLYKGISGDLVDEIHDTLYRLSRGGREVPSMLLAGAEVLEARSEPVRQCGGSDVGRPQAGEQPVQEESGADRYVLRVLQADQERTFELRTSAIVAATGYSSSVPPFLAPIADRVRLDRRGRLDVSREYTIDDEGRLHVLNAEEHTHGVTAPDLGFGAWRASVVLAAITGREPYPIERRIAFQTFGAPGTAGAFGHPGTVSADPLADETTGAHASGTGVDNPVALDHTEGVTDGGTAATAHTPAQRMKEAVSR